jgi:anti-sigma B factor antagonist
MAYEFPERVVDGVAIVSIGRGLKGDAQEALRQHLDSLLRRGFDRILIDLKEVPYIDSSDLGRLIRCHLSIRQAGGRVRLCNLSARVREVMKMTRLDTVLDLYETEEEALSSLQKVESVHRVGYGASGDGA